MAHALNDNDKEELINECEAQDKDTEVIIENCRFVKEFLHSLANRGKDSISEKALSAVKNICHDMENLNFPTDLE